MMDHAVWWSELSWLLCSSTGHVIKGRINLPRLESLLQATSDDSVTDKGNSCAQDLLAIQSLSGGRHQLSWTTRLKAPTCMISE